MYVSIINRFATERAQSFKSRLALTQPRINFSIHDVVSKLAGKYLSSKFGIDKFYPFKLQTVF